MNLARELIIGAFWARAAGATATGATQGYSVPTGPGPYTVTVPGWVGDLAVIYADNYQPLTLVASGPAAGQYSVAAGVYTFNATDAGRPLRISFKPPAVSPFITLSRRLKHWVDVPANLQPALYMVQNLNTVKQTKGVPPKWGLHPKLYIYDNCGSDPQADTGNRINWLIDAIDQALAPNVLGRQTLGDLVSHCWISGPVEVYEGFDGMMDQSVAIIPIDILVPDSSGPA